MKGCELCSYAARIYCEADHASLCSNCDEKVHSANFLVAKHSRSLLCHVCQSPTPWKASGTKLGPTVSVCESCVRNCSSKGGRVAERDEESRGGMGNDEIEEDFGSEDDCSDDDDEDENEVFSDGSEGDDEDEEDGDNQVVPWSSSPAPPPVATSSSSEDVSSSGIFAAGGSGVSASKRTRENADIDFEDEIASTSSRFNHNIAKMAMVSQVLEKDVANSSCYLRSTKLQRINESFQSERTEDHNVAESMSVGMMVRSVRKLEKHKISDDNDASSLVIGISRLIRDPTAA